MTKALLSILFALFMATAQAQHIGFGNIVPIGTNTVMGNATAATASMSPLTVGGCSSASSALIWTTNTGFGCNTSIGAATATTAGTVTTAAQPAITSVGTLTSLALSGAISLGTNVIGYDSTHGLQFDSTGDIGLGVTPSAWSGLGGPAVESNAGFNFIANNSRAYINENAYWNGSNWIRKTTNFATQYIVDQSDGSNTWNTAASGAAGSTIAWATKMSLGTSGAYTLPGLSTSSAATTGAMCWTSGTGNVNVDTTTTCLLSSGKYKKQERPLNIGLKQVLALRPVSYRLKDRFNPAHLGEQIGFFAEDVAKVDGRLVSKEKDGTPHAVRYQQLTALLARAIQQQQRQIKTLSKRITELETQKMTALH